MSDFFYSTMEDLYGLYKVEPPKEIGLSVYFTRPESGLRIAYQMEDNPHGILMVAELGRLPSGSTRLAWLQEALKWNSEIGCIGILSINQAQDILVIGHLFPINHVNGQILYESVEAFEARALPWKNAINQGYPPSFSGGSNASMAAPSPMSIAGNSASSSRYRLRP